MTKSEQMRDYVRRKVLLARWAITSFKSLAPTNCSNSRLGDSKVLDIIAVAFNDADLIQRQYAALKIHLRDPFAYTVFDNSLDDAKRAEIRQVCGQASIGYIGLPKNPYSGRAPSSSHGLALNWAYRHYVRPRASKYFGFLDHDVFLTKPDSIIKRLKSQPLYGHAQKRGERWYLWPGFSFFDRAFVGEAKLNFMPQGELDTGGGNWPVLFSRLDRTKLAYPHHRYQSLTKGEDAQADKVEWFDDWVHMINASNWKKLAGKKSFRF